MGMRSQRYAMIIESGKITSINIDASGLEKSAAEYILSLL
jgi:peroxiredoxin